MRHRFEENPAAQSLHFFECGLEFSPLRDGRSQPFILLLGKSHADRFAFDLASPLITGAAGAGTAILHVALTDPTDASETSAQLRILDFPLGQGRLF